MELAVTAPHYAMGSLTSVYQHLQEVGLSVGCFTLNNCLIAFTGYNNCKLIARLILFLRAEVVFMSEVRMMHFSKY